MKLEHLKKRLDRNRPMTTVSISGYCGRLIGSHARPQR
jgi:hypothetical protein